ncbi:hypothetical protein K466DRAFT_566967 [Polyporus arcularius HHB13444]|uniref:Uncharacterized protein n=1 Tax=Polyporus arcularius HHB13444 TaxID=1314778 RepID=A0A5C3P7E8_9APHY|nr:hypothetical protein K466DRAFT_566967 [Polyporus arcularius HHB13444]
MHFIYAFRFSDYHLKYRNSVPEEPRNCQLIREDQLPPIPSFVSYLRTGDDNIMWDLIRTAGGRLRRTRFIAGRGILEDALLYLDIFIHNAKTRYNSPCYNQIKILKIILDIRVVANCTAKQTAPGDSNGTCTAATLEDRHVEELIMLMFVINSALKKAYIEDNRYGTSTLLRIARTDFHNAIVAAGFIKNECPVRSERESRTPESGEDVQVTAQWVPAMDLLSILSYDTLREDGLTLTMFKSQTVRSGIGPASKGGELRESERLRGREGRPAAERVSLEVACERHVQCLNTPRTSESYSSWPMALQSIKIHEGHKFTAHLYAADIRLSGRESDYPASPTPTRAKVVDKPAGGAGGRRSEVGRMID